MKAYVYTPTTSQLKLIEEDYLKHKKRVEQIVQDSKKTKVRDDELTQNLKMSQTLQNNMKLAHNEKNTSIDKDNQMLLSKLVDISKRKPNLYPGKAEALQLKTLHGPYRRKELDRIFLENEALAKRLLNQQSSVNRKKLEKDFKKHQTMVVNIKRVGSQSQKAISKKLPPLKVDMRNSSVEANEVKSSASQKLPQLKEEPQAMSAPLPNNKSSSLASSTVQDSKAPEVDQTQKAPVEEAEKVEETKKEDEPQKVEPTEKKEEEEKKVETKAPEPVTVAPVQEPEVKDSTAEQTNQEKKVESQPEATKDKEEAIEEKKEVEDKPAEQKEEIKEETAEVKEDVKQPEEAQQKVEGDAPKEQN